MKVVCITDRNFNYITYNKIYDVISIVEYPETGSKRIKYKIIRIKDDTGAVHSYNMDNFSDYDIILDQRIDKILY
jgi:hypothetical protein